MTDLARPSLDIEIAPLQERDIEDVADVAARSYAETFGPIMTQANLAATLLESRSVDYFTEAHQQKRSIFVAKHAGAVVGYTMFGEVHIPEVNDHELYGPEDRELSRLYIDPNFQGKGVGGRLLDMALGHNVLASAPNVWLQVWEQNPNAKGLYESRDFETVGVTEYETGYVTEAKDLIMVRPQPTQ